MANEEIGNYEQFLLLPLCFQKSSAVDASESIYMWERVKGKELNLSILDVHPLRTTMLKVIMSW